MAETIRYGIIGTGMMGCEHIRNIGLIPGTRVTAAADPEPMSRECGRLAAEAAANDVRVYETGTASHATPAARWSRSVATSST